jgi:hypothetical protein
MITLPDVWKVALAVIGSIGGGGVVVAAFSGFLGKIWAERLMASDRAQHEAVLLKLRTALENENQRQLTEYKTSFEIVRETYLKEHNDKLATYRMVVDVISELLANLGPLRSGQPLGNDVLDRFNHGRLRAHGYLAMIAPQDVMDAYDQLTDRIFSVLEKNPPGFGHDDWEQVRGCAYSLINKVRADVGIGKDAVEYRGKR